jgi:hypothetical protein
MPRKTDAARWIAALTISVCVACASESERVLPQVYSGDRIVSAERLTTRPAGRIEALVRLGGAEIEARYDVAFYQLVYRTVDAAGQPTTASGSVMVPVDPLAPLPLLSYQHGTIVAKDDAPSKGGLEQLIAFGWAAVGYVAVVSDYLGLGEGPGFHPYMHAASEASAVLDLLRAAEELLDVGGVDLADELFLAGYSQGGTQRWRLCAKSRQTTPMSSRSPQPLRWRGRMTCPRRCWRRCWTVRPSSQGLITSPIS